MSIRKEGMSPPRFRPRLWLATPILVHIRLDKMSVLHPDADAEAGESEKWKPLLTHPRARARINSSEHAHVHGCSPDVYTHAQRGGVNVHGSEGGVHSG